MDDRRSFARIDHQHLVSYAQQDAADGNDEGMAKTLNLSAHGLLMMFSHEIDTGAKLELELNLDGTIVKVSGKAIRSTPDATAAGMFDVGIALDHVPEEFSGTVERYLAKAEKSEL